MGTWMSLGSSLSAEYLAELGFDFISIDHEHGSFGFDTVLRMLQAIRGGSASPIVRVGENSPESIKRTLDAGALGVIVPHIQSVEDARAAVREAKYAPLGLRSFGGRRWTIYGEDFQQRANDETLLIVLIEDIEAVKNTKAILSVPGVDACLIGPCDLGMSMGLEPDIECRETQLADAVHEVLNVGKTLAIPVGLHCTSSEVALRRIAEGFSFVMIGADDVFVIEGAKSVLAGLKELNRTTGTK